VTVRPGCRSSRAVSGQRDAVHDAAEAVIIVDRMVKGTAIVPKRGRAGLPADGRFGPEAVVALIASRPHF
jgi:hypothetical protein